MERSSPLNDKQLETLRLIGAGDDLRGQEHIGRRSTGRALQSRGLVTVSKRDGIWRATITEAGRHFLDQGEHLGSSAATPRPPRQQTRPTSSTPGGSRHRSAGLPPVTVPDQLDQSHPVIARLRDDTGRMAMPSEVRHRALRLLQGLAAAAVEHGWGVTGLPVNLEGCHAEFQQEARYRAGTIEIKLGDFRYEVTVDQKSPKASDPVKAGHLKIALPWSHADLQSTWTDAKTAALEQRLPEVIEALAGRGAADQERAESATLTQATQQAAREAEAARDRARAVEDFLARELDRQARALERWRFLTDYCDQLEAHLEAADPQAAQTESARAWLAWARTHTATIDPFKALPVMPEVPDDLSSKIPFGPAPDVFAGRSTANPGRSRMWETVRRFHPNG